MTRPLTARRIDNSPRRAGVAAYGQLVRQHHASQVGPMARGAFQQALTIGRWTLRFALLGGATEESRPP